MCGTELFRNHMEVERTVGWLIIYGIEKVHCAIEH